MKIAITQATIEAIKADLRQTLSGFKSSHRAEAIARGLGLRTNSALMATPARGQAECTLNPGAFTAFLAERGHVVDARALVRAVLRVLVRAVMNAHEDLTHSGFGIPGGYRLPFFEWRRQFAEAREEMLADSAVYEFERACEYLSFLEVTKTINRHHSSNHLKHAAERFHQRRGFQEKWNQEYVSNGMLLAAAHHLGFKVCRAVFDSFEGYVNVSTRSVRDVEDEAKPPLPRPEAGQLFRVLGYDHGRYFFLPAGSAKIVTLRADALTPANLLRLAPLSYWVDLFPPRNRRAPFNTMDAAETLILQAGKAGLFLPDEYRLPRS